MTTAPKAMTQKEMQDAITNQLWNEDVARLWDISNPGQHEVTILDQLRWIMSHLEQTPGNIDKVARIEAVRGAGDKAGVFNALLELSPDSPYFRLISYILRGPNGDGSDLPDWGGIAAEATDLGIEEAKEETERVILTTTLPPTPAPTPSTPRTPPMPSFTRPATAASPPPAPAAMPDGESGSGGRPAASGRTPRRTRNR